MFNKKRSVSSTIKGLASSLPLWYCLTAYSPVGIADETVDFHIVAQPLATALRAFAEQADIDLLYSPEEVAGDMAPEVSGIYLPAEALERLLQHSRMTFTVNEKGAIAIVADSPQGSKSPEKGISDQSSIDLRAVLEEIIVTAEKRAEGIQEIPIAISAFSGERIENAGVTGISDLKQLAPSLQFGQQVGTNTFVSIRGIGSDLSDIGAENGVIVSQDGVPLLNQFMLDADFFDVERVEVLRGPQGTIAGRNATGGAINIHSKLPTENFAGGFKTTVGNHSRFGAEGYLSGPIAGSKLLGRLAVRTEKADGWLTNTFLGEDRFDEDKVQARASFMADLADNLEAHLILDGIVDRGIVAGGVDLGRVRPDQPGFTEVYGLPATDLDSLKYESDFFEASRVENYKGIVKLAWDIGSSTHIAATTGYISYTGDSASDFDGTRVAAAHFPVVLVDLWQASQEVTLTADLTDRLDVILGGLYLRGNAKEPINFGLPLLGVPVGSLDFRPEQDLVSYAAYTQWRYRLTDDLRLAFGARYTYDKKDFFEEDSAFDTPFSTVSDSKSWGAFTPRLAVDYTPSADMTLYGSVSRGFKAGGFNAFGTIVVPGVPNDFDPEFVWNYEAGMKANWLERRLWTALTGFYMDYKDLQQGLLRPPPGGGIALRTVENASAATIVGVELEIEAQFTESFKITASSTWLEATYDKLRTDDQVFPELGERDLAGNRLPRAPEWQFNLAAEYTAPLAGEWFGVLRGGYQWQDEVFFSFYNYEDTSEDPYGLLNLAAAIETINGRWQITAFARNMLDKRYIVGAQTSANDGITNSLYGSVGAPRMYGLSLVFNYR